MITIIPISSSPDVPEIRGLLTNYTSIGNKGNWEVDWKKEKNKTRKNRKVGVLRGEVDKRSVSKPLIRVGL